MSEKEIVLNVAGLCTEFKTPFGKVKAIDGVDLYLRKGETLGIVGESGCGKSVTSLSVMGLLPNGVGKVTDGIIMFDNMNLAQVNEATMRKIRGNKIAMIFQEPMSSLNPIFKIGKQVEEVLIRHKHMKRKEARKETIRLFTEVGISRPEVVVDNYPHELSGGMLQRVMIAMGLACQPEVLIADEPTTALDVTIQAQILELMMKLKKEHDTAIMLITHNLGVVAEVCDRVAVMYAGYVVEEAPVAELFDHPLHPYTQGLMKCAPRLDEDRTVLDTIPGLVPSLHEMPAGCRFANRCPHCTDRCIQEKPVLRTVGEGHKCRCHLIGKDGEKLYE